MPIITIYRGAFSGGQAVAERVAGELGYRCLSREVLQEASQRYGIPETKFTEGPGVGTPLVGKVAGEPETLSGSPSGRHVRGGPGREFGLPRTCGS